MMLSKVIKPSKSICVYTIYVYVFVYEIVSLVFCKNVFF